MWSRFIYAVTGAIVFLEREPDLSHADLINYEYQAPVFWMLEIPKHQSNLGRLVKPV